MYKLDNGLPSRIVVACFERAFKADGAGLSRRSLLRRGGHWPLTAGVGAALTGCENTTTPVAADGAGGGRGKGILGDPTAGGPVDSAGIPLARRDYPVMLPQARRRRSRARRSPSAAASCRSTTTPTTSTRRSSRRSASRRASASASPRSTRSTRRSRSSAPAASSSTSSSPRPTSSRGSSGRELIQPLNFELIPNLQKNVWPELHSPFYDVGPRYSVPYTLYTTGIALAQRHARLRPEQARPAVGRVLVAAGREVPRQGRRSSTTRARAPGMALMRRGVTDLNTEDPDLLARAGDDLEELNATRRA